MPQAGQTPALPDLHDALARRFPLVPRTRPPCLPLGIRVARIRDLARAAATGGSESITRAAEAHNLAALVLSDCGLPVLAQDLCWQQWEILRAAGPSTAAMAKLALQPLINLSRLLTRDGDGDGAYQLLDSLLRGVRSGTDIMVDGRTISSSHLTASSADHREVIGWLWSVFLADGTRALARAGRWAEALRSAEQHHGIGCRLLDGRQAAVLARCTARDYDAAHSTLAGTSTPTAWEAAVAACLDVLCRTLAGHPSEPAAATMTDAYLALDQPPEHAVFRARLGLCVLDLAGEDRRRNEITARIAGGARDTSDAYPAHDALAHETCASLMDTATREALAHIVRAAGLSRGTMPAELLTSLTESVRISETAMVRVLASPRSSLGVNLTAGRP